MSNENRDFLDELVTAEQAAPTTEAEEADQGEQQEQQQTVEQVQQPEAPATEATTATEVKEPQTVPLAAMKAEREKRQRLERELAEERAKHQSQQTPTPSYYEDPEGYLARAQNDIEQRATARLNAALEAQAREQYPDYEEKLGVVMEHAQGNPAIVQEIMTAPNPAVAAYKMGQRLSEFQQMQDPEAYRAKVEAEVRAKIEAENKAKADQRQKAASEIPPDLSQARNTRGEFTPKSDVFNELFKG
jgi:hypothetical protein